MQSVRYIYTCTWRELAQERNFWHNTIKHKVKVLNKQAKDTEKSHKDEKKRRCEHRLMDSENPLHYSHPGCSFQALNKADPGCSFQALNKAGLTTISANVVIPLFPWSSASTATRRSTSRGFTNTSTSAKLGIHICGLSHVGLHLLHP